jgi:hypothetical protein
MTNNRAMIGATVYIKQTPTLESWAGAGTRHMKGLKTMCRYCHCTAQGYAASNSRVRRLRFPLVCARLREETPQTFRAAQVMVTLGTALVLTGGNVQ